MTTLILAFLTAHGMVTQTHQYQDAEACALVAHALDGQPNPLGEPMLAFCVKEPR